MRIASEFDSGMVGVNCISLMSVSIHLTLETSANRFRYGRMMQAPFGGSKQSGVGRECGISALRAFTDPKTVSNAYAQEPRVRDVLTDATKITDYDQYDVLVTFSRWVLYQLDSFCEIKF